MRWFGSLRRPGEIAYVRRTGRRSTASTIALHVACDRTPGTWKIAITVSKAVGNAVVRNRVKRRIKGALDALDRPAVRARAVIVVRAAAAEAPYARLAADVAAMVGRSVA